jgi:uncharacterized membrane protein YphA (DoxX/SURF4 family)
MNIKTADWKKLTITILRVAIGWHFLYEGLSKIFMDGWTSKAYLANSTGFLSEFYLWLSQGGSIVRVVDFINIYGLILIGLFLFVGVFIRISAGGGILLLVLYYFAYPPFGSSLFGSLEGHLFIVNKNFIEAFVLLWFVLSKKTGYSLEMLIKSRRLLNDAIDKEGEFNETSDQNSRREALKNLASLPFLGALGWGAFRRSNNEVDVMSGATIQLDFSSLNELKGELPKGRIGEHELSRLILGGNLIGGWAHTRDLLYGPSLFKAYNTERKIYETLMLAEKAGINSINIGFPTNELMAKYKRITGSKIKVISQVPPDMEKNDYYININKAIDYGADIIQVHGYYCDKFAKDNRLDVIEKMLDRIRSQGYTAGLGAHTVDALIACEEAGIIPDYYMKTMHHDNYWSAHPRENRTAYEVVGENNLDHNKYHDNLFCSFPDRSIEFVNKATIPVMGFKVLAAGAIEPSDGFNWAFKNGADFICVGMFDFQIVDDVNISIDVLNNLKDRKRDWFG